MCRDRGSRKGADLNVCCEAHPAYDKRSRCITAPVHHHKAKRKHQYHVDMAVVKIVIKDCCLQLKYTAWLGD